MILSGGDLAHVSCKSLDRDFLLRPGQICALKVHQVATHGKGLGSLVPTMEN